MPDNIALMLFKENFVRQYALRHERTDKNRLTLRFNAPLDTMLVPQPLNFTPSDSSWYIAQWTEEKHSLTYWLTDSLVWQQDTLRFAITYPASDSLNVLRPQTDTIALNMRGRAAEATPFLGMNVKASGTIEVFDTVSVVFDEPVQGLSSEHFKLEIRQDTLWIPADFEFLPDTANALAFYLNRKWSYGETYRLVIDSATIYSIYGKWNDLFNQSFNVKADDQYGHLYLNIVGVDTIPAFVELLDGSDQAIRKSKVANGGALFMDLPPGKYYARLILDENDNFVWDTGNYAEKKQAEKVCYYPKVIEIMKNWRIEIQDPPWDIYATPLPQQKPLDITKNKPKEVTKPKRDYKNEGKGQSSGNSNPMGRSMPF
jgi:hypothetical protein